MKIVTEINQLIFNIKIVQLNNFHKNGNLFAKIEIIDKVETVSLNDSIKNVRTLAKKEGIMASISSGAALSIAKKYAENHPNKKIVTILPDTGERYTSTILFNEK